MIKTTREIINLQDSIGIGNHDEMDKLMNKRWADVEELKLWIISERNELKPLLEEVQKGGSVDVGLITRDIMLIKFTGKLIEED